MKNSEITYIFGTGREKKLSDKFISDEFFYGYIYFKNLYSNTTLIELDESLKNSNFSSKLIFIFDRILNKMSNLPFYMNEVLTFDNFKKITKSKNLILTNDRIGISLLPVLIYLKIFKKINVIVIVMGLLNNKQGGKLVNFIQRVFIKLFLTLCDKFVFLGKGEFDVASKMYSKNKKKFKFIPFGVDTKFWNDDQETFNNNNKEFILFIGNDSKREFNKVVEISKILKNHKFIFVTTNINDKDIGKNVELINGSWNKLLLTDNEIKEIYTKGTLTILPLKNTFQPSGQSVALQSMAMGVPVLITKTKGFWDFKSFINNQNIFFIESNSVSKWAELIESLIQNEELLNKVSTNGKKLVHENFTSQMFNLELHKLIQ